MEPVNSKKARKELILLVTGIVIVMFFVFGHFFSPVSRCIKNNEDINIVVFGKTPSLVVYHPVSRTVNVVKIPGRLLKSQDSNYQKAWRIFSSVAKRSPYPGTVWLFYVDMGQSIPDFDGYAEILGNWRGSPRLLWKVFSVMNRFNREHMTSFSAYDWWLLFLEMINLNASNLVITEASKTAPGGITFSVAPENYEEEAGKIAKVEVFNATNMKNAAKTVTRFLRDRGFDVINFGNYSKNEKQTRIILWRGNLSTAKRVRDAIGMNSIEIYSESNKFKITDATLIIGEDFNKSIITEDSDDVKRKE